MDRKPVLAVVIFLGVIALACIGGAIALTALDKGVPDGIWTTTGTAVGAIAAVLTSARYNAPNEPAPVNVVNAPDQPIPVDTAPEDPTPGPDDGAPGTPGAHTGETWAADADGIPTPPAHQVPAGPPPA